MKNFFLIFTLIILGYPSQAQVVLFEQTSGNAAGFTSGYANLGTPMGFYSSDDFQLTTQTDIYSVTVYGLQPENDLETTYLTGFSLYIYADASGVPLGDPSVSGSALLEIVNLPLSSPALTVDHPGTSLYNFTVDILMAEGVPLSLSAGTYWIVAAPHLDIDPATVDPNGDNRIWFWLLSGQINLSDAHFIDPSNFLGAGWTSWTPITSHPTSSPSSKALAFTVMGDTQAAIVDNSLLAQISLYPNPTSDKLYIKMPASTKLESAFMVDLLGKRTQIKIGKNNTLDVSKMASGIYFLQLETPVGTATKKVIKK